MITIKQSGAHKCGADKDKQESVVFPRVEAGQRHDAYHQGMELRAALPRGAAQEKVGQAQAYKEDNIGQHPIWEQLRESKFVLSFPPSFPISFLGTLPNLQSFHSLLYMSDERAYS